MHENARNQVIVVIVIIVIILVAAIIIHSSNNRKNGRIYSSHNRKNVMAIVDSTQVCGTLADLGPGHFISIIVVSSFFSIILVEAIYIYIHT